MPMTITEKILAAHCGREEVRPGELITAKIDMVLANDITTPPAITMLKEKGRAQYPRPGRPQPEWHRQKSLEEAGQQLLFDVRHESVELSTFDLDRPANCA